MGMTGKLTPEEAAAIRETELRNAIARLEKGGRLTKREQALIDAAAGSVPVEDGGPVIDSRELAARYGCDVRTVQRINKIAGLPGSPRVPWEDPEALRVWYRENYRSEPSKPPSRTAVLPEWLRTATGAKKSATPATTPTTPQFLPSSGPLDVLEQMRVIIAQKRARFEADRSDLAAERDYLDSLSRFTEIEKRSLASGAAGYLSTARVESIIEEIHGRIPRRLEADLTAIFLEVRRVMTGPDAETGWRDLVAQFVTLACRRMRAGRFAELTLKPV